MNYAEIRGDNEIIKIIKNLEDTNRKNEIRMEIKDLVNNGMNNFDNIKDTSS